MAVSKNGAGDWAVFSAVAKAHRATVVTPSRNDNRADHC